MELLRFDSRRPTAKYRGLVELLREKLAEVLVVTSDAQASREPLFGVLGGLGDVQYRSLAAS